MHRLMTTVGEIEACSRCHISIQIQQKHMAEAAASALIHVQGERRVRTLGFSIPHPQEGIGQGLTQEYTYELPGKLQPIHHFAQGQLPVFPLQSFYGSTGRLFQGFNGHGRVGSFPKKLIERQEGTLRKTAPCGQRIDFTLESTHLSRQSFVSVSYQTIKQLR